MTGEYDVIHMDTYAELTIQIVEYIARLSKEITAASAAKYYNELFYNEMALLHAGKEGSPFKGNKEVIEDLCTYILGSYYGMEDSLPPLEVGAAHATGIKNPSTTNVSLDAILKCMDIIPALISIIDDNRLNEATLSSTSISSGLGSKFQISPVTAKIQMMSAKKATRRSKSHRPSRSTAVFKQVQGLHKQAKYIKGRYKHETRRVPSSSVRESYAF